MITKLIGRRIRQARERLGLTQEELAARIGKTQDAISGYENGNRAMRVTELPQLAQALDVPIAYFFGDVEIDEEVAALLAQFPPERRSEIIARLHFELELYRRSEAGKEDQT